jgi:hypothetical protein
MPICPVQTLPAVQRSLTALLVGLHADIGVAADNVDVGAEPNIPRYLKPTRFPIWGAASACGMLMKSSKNYSNVLFSAAV